MVPSARSLTLKINFVLIGFLPNFSTSDLSTFLHAFLLMKFMTLLAMGSCHPRDKACFQFLGSHGSEVIGELKVERQELVSSTWSVF